MGIPSIKIASHLTVLLCFLLSCSTLSAQEPADYDDLESLYGDEETVSVATGSSKAVRLAPSTASVITAEQIYQMGANSLEDVLQTIPGIHVSLRGIYASNYSVRGIMTAYTPQVLLLLNGYPLAEAYSATKISIQKVPIKNIKRIEIIRGPGSAVYGADAYAGVVNIITYDNSDITGTKIQVGVGNFDTQNAWLQTKTDIGSWELGLSLEWEKSAGDPDRIIASDLQSTFDVIFGTNASLAPEAASTHYRYVNSQINLSKDEWNIGLNTYYQDKAGIGTGIADALDPNGNQYYHQNIFEIKYTGEESDYSDWRHEATLNYFQLKQKSDYTIFPEGALLPIGADGNINFVTPVNLVLFTEGYIGIPAGRDDYYSGDMVSFYNGHNDHQLRIAAGYKYQSVKLSELLNFGPGVLDGSQTVVDGTLTDITGTPNIFLPDLTRKNYYISIQDEWSFSTDWEMTVGLRYDDYSDFGNTLNPRLAVVWQSSYKLTSKFLYGRAFRAPSLSELFVVNNPDILGNPTLKPETIDTFEISLDYRFNYNFRTALNIFSYRADKLIKFVPDNNILGSNTAQNSAGQKGSGVELELQWEISDAINLIGNYSRQISKQRDTDTDVADAPQQLLFAAVDWTISPNWAAYLQVNRVGSRPRDITDPRPALQDYSFINLTLHAKDLIDNVDLRFIAKNVADKAAFEPGNPTVPIDHPLPGRHILLDVRYSF